MRFVWFSPSAGLGRSGCTVGLGAAGSRGSVEGSVEAHVPGSGRWRARQGIGQTPGSTRSHNPLRPSRLHKYTVDCLIFSASRSWTDCVKIRESREVEHVYMWMWIHTVVEVELRYGQQDPGKRQVWAEPAKEPLDARERSEDQRVVLYTHAVQDAHRLHQTLREGTGQIELRPQCKNLLSA